MKVDALVAEIGSTTTVVNAFTLHDTAAFVGKGVANTTVDTDVREGLREAIEDLKHNLGVDTLEYDEMFSSSSAAGGLRITVSGLVYEMTVRAAKEAALNAGGNVHYVSAGPLDTDDLEQILEAKPNIVIVAGGTDYGEKNVAFDNLKQIETLVLNVPIIYAGNIDNHYRIRKHFEESSQKAHLQIVENVYPRVDFLNILPLRKVIHETFEKHIIHAKGMKHVKEMVDQAIIPTPGSVMESTMLLHEAIGNVMTIDVGGATTDVHSVAEPSDEYRKYAEGEAKEKRTVEGDLGVFVNFHNVLSSIDRQRLMQRLGVDETTFNRLVEDYTYMPNTKEERKLVYELTRVCVNRALDRHVGNLKKVYTSNGQKFIPEGKDLTQVQTIVLTGGPLIHLDDTERIVLDYIKQNPDQLLPGDQVRVVKDHDYVMASLGVLSLKYKHIAQEILKKSMRLSD